MCRAASSSRPLQRERRPERSESGEQRPGERCERAARVGLGARRAAAMSSAESAESTAGGRASARPRRSRRASAIRRGSRTTSCALGLARAADIRHIERTRGRSFQRVHGRSHAGHRARRSAAPQLVVQTSPVAPNPSSCLVASVEIEFAACDERARRSITGTRTVRPS